MKLKPGFELTQAIHAATPQVATGELLPYMMPAPAELEYIENPEPLKKLWIDTLFCIPAELMDEHNKYIGPNSISEDVHIVDIGHGIVFQDSEASFCFEAFDCTHTCHWRIDPATGEGTSVHIARDAAGNERAFKVWHRMSARITNLNKRSKGFELPRSQRF